MENLNAEQVKNNIEYCIEGECENCPYDEQTSCREYLLHDALALITSQEQRIKELMSTSSLQGAIIGGLRTTANELTADKERLEKLLDDKCDRCIERERADTVRKMHFEIQQRCIKGGIYPAFVGCTVDKVAYEMTGDEFYIAKFRMEDVEGNE